MERPVMIYNGGKFLLKDWIIPLLPEHEIYVEPFGGAASVLMSKVRSKREVYNDLSSDVVNVFRVLRDKKLARELERRLRLTPFAREEVWTAKKPRKNIGMVERARLTIVCAFLSRSRTSRDGAGMRYSKQSHRAPEADWVTYADCIQDFAERIRGVMIENKPAVDVIKFWDSPTTLFYCDPPYVHSSRSDNDMYAHELTDTDHIQLLEHLNKVQGMVVLSGYDSELYRSKLDGWVTKNTQSRKNTHEKTIEVLWFNKRAIEKSRQLDLFNESNHQSAPSDEGQSPAFSQSLVGTD